MKKEILPKEEKHSDQKNPSPKAVSPDAEIKKLEEKIKELSAKLEASQKKEKENLEGWQRAKADFINYRNRIEKERGEMITFMQKELVFSLLPVVDNFEKAFLHLPENLKKEQWIKGIEQIKLQLEKILKDQGLSGIKTLGEKFDPNLHEAVGLVEAKGKEGVIVEEVEKGYKIGETVIKPSKVKVGK